MHPVHWNSASTQGHRRLCQLAHSQGQVTGDSLNLMPGRKFLVFLSFVNRPGIKIEHASERNLFVEVSHEVTESQSLTSLWLPRGLHKMEVP
jgi:hypothetical protein